MYGVAKNWPWFKNDARVLQKLRRSYNKKSVTRLEVCSERNHIEPAPDIRIFKHGVSSEISGTWKLNIFI